MAKFRFEALLKIREAERNEKKNAFLLAQSRVQEAQDALRSCERELDARQNEARILRSSPVLNANELRQNQRFLNIQIGKRNEALSELNARENDAEELRKQLDEAVKEVKILETLKEKTEERRLENERRRSDKEMDELATQQKSLERQKANKDELN